MIPTEPVDFAEIVKKRKEEAAKTIHEIPHEELAATAEKLFPTADHPWGKVVHDFLENHKGQTILTGDVQEGYHFVYSPNTKNGFWYGLLEHVHAVGPLNENAVKALSEIVSEKGLS